MFFDITVVVITTVVAVPLGRLNSLTAELMVLLNGNNMGVVAVLPMYVYSHRALLLLNINIY